LGEDLLDHRPLEVGRDDLQFPGATVRPVVHVDAEDPFEQPHPADAMWPDLDRLDLALGSRSGFGGRLLLIRWPLRQVDVETGGRAKALDVLLRSQAIVIDRADLAPRAQRRLSKGGADFSASWPARSNASHGPRAARPR
jgi:hypothetical protein